MSKKKYAMKFMEHFIDDNDHPEEIDDGYVDRKDIMWNLCEKAGINISASML
jgi:hypothetical protein